MLIECAFVVTPERSYITELALSLAYIDEVERALIYIRETPDISNEEKKRFFKSANTNLGTSALCLSGGASFGYCTYDDPLSRHNGIL